MHYPVSLQICSIESKQGYLSIISAERDNVITILVFTSLQLVVSRYSDSPSSYRTFLELHMQYEGYQLSLLYQKALELESSQSPYFPEGDSTIEKKA